VILVLASGDDPCVELVRRAVDDWPRDRDLVRSFRPYEDLPEAVRANLFALLDRLE
jgi:hypothetical protein